MGTWDGDLDSAGLGVRVRGTGTGSAVEQTEARRATLRGDRGGGFRTRSQPRSVSEHPSLPAHPGATASRQRPGAGDPASQLESHQPCWREQRVLGGGAPGGGAPRAELPTRRGCLLSPLKSHCAEIGAFPVAAASPPPQPGTPSTPRHGGCQAPGWSRPAQGPGRGAAASVGLRGAVVHSERLSSAQGLWPRCVGTGGGPTSLPVGWGSPSLGPDFTASCRRAGHRPPAPMQARGAPTSGHVGPDGERGRSLARGAAGGGWRPLGRCVPICPGSAPCGRSPRVALPSPV